jgi:hypothetical protein
MKKGLLEKTTCTVIGPMQYSNGQNVRNFFKKELGKMKIIVYDHYNKPFLNDYVKENEQTAKKLKGWLENEEYDKISEARYIRIYDLNLIDRSDFIIFHFIPGVVTVGSWEEFFWANRCKKVIFFITEGGKKLTPWWVFWTIDHKYIYSSKEEVLQMIKDINSQKKKIDSDRWKLLDYKYR